MLAGLLAAAVLAVDPSPPAIPTPTSGSAGELITAVCAGVAAIIVAVGTVQGLRRRRAAEAELAAPDPESSPVRMRERLTAAETRIAEHDRRLGDIEERQTLSRAVDVAIEAQASPAARRRRSPS